MNIIAFLGENFFWLAAVGQVLQASLLSVKEDIVW